MTIHQRKLPPRVRELILAVAQEHRVDADDLFGRGGSRECTAAKRVIVTRLSELGVSDTRIGLYLGMHASSAGYLRRHTAEERREARERAIAEPIPVVDLSGEWAI